MPQPQFFDIFGLASFTFIIVSSVWALATKKPLPRWTPAIFLLIGIGGIIVDGSIVYFFFLR